jgi:hypothetical protein
MLAIFTKIFAFFKKCIYNKRVLYKGGIYEENRNYSSSNGSNYFG